MDSQRFQTALERFDAANAADPNREVVDGVAHPSALLYGQRMTRRLEQFQPDASEALRLAVRAQHLCRWVIPRGAYAEGVKGYNLWRRAMQLFHAEKAGEILGALGYGEERVARVQFLLRKERRTQDAEAQTLEDIAGLVFLEHYFAAFIEQHAYDDAKLMDIVRKTWRKLSPQAHAAAAALQLPPRAQAIVVAALAGN
jgi:hypothetical protein